MGEPRQRLLWDDGDLDGCDVAKEPDPSPLIARAKSLKADLDRLCAVDITRRLEGLGLAARDVCPELAHFIHARRQGVIILLSLVARGKIRMNAEAKARAQAILDGCNEAHPFALAVDTDDLGVAPRKRSYRKLNGVILGLRTNVDVLRSLTEGSRAYYRELLGEIIAGNARSMGEARRLQIERHPMRLPDSAAEAV